LSEQAAAIDPVDSAGRLRLVAWLGTRAGWKRHLAAFLLGALAGTATPPFYDLIGFAVAVTGLVWIGDGCARSRHPGRAAFWSGWFFGFGYFLVGLWWIANAPLVDPGRWWWVVPFAAVGLPTVLPIFWAVAMWVWRRIGFTGPGRVAALAGMLGIGEWLRGKAFTGFPWNMPGYIWWPFDSVLQSASWVGLYGVTVVTLLIMMSPAAGIDGATGRIGRRAWAWPAAGLALLAAVAVGGHLRLAAAPDVTAPEANVPGVVLRLVQPNFSQTEKWTEALRNHNVARQIEMSKIEGWQQVTHVIWSETAVTFAVADKPELLAELAIAAPVGGYLLTGAPRVSVGIDSQTRVHNALLAISPTAQIAASYDKAHLVPFGEYVPFGEWLGMGGVAGGFTPGPGPQTLSLPGLPPFSPLICYEAIFPGEVVADPPAERPQWLLNITNDAWYGDSPGPRQHLQISRARAIEEGLPLVRVANTGISGVFDAYGRERVPVLDLGLYGVLDSPLPVALEGGTLYATIGDTAFWAIAVILIIAGVVSRRRTR
jgi:apolipoprotein N-acyltransferase